MILSIFEKQSQLLDSIEKLHLGGLGVEVDLTYGRGSIHAGRPHSPKIRMDLEPVDDSVRRRDCRATCLNHESINSVLFDPPFLAGGGKKSVMHGHYSSYRTVPSLLKFYGESLDEIARILKPNGILIFKCQDINNGKTQGFSHCDIYRMATERGLYGLDLFILINRNRMPPPKMKQQVHARKAHCYFWVFKKCDRRNHGRKNT